MSEGVFADVESGDILIEDEDGDFVWLMELYVLTNEEWKEIVKETNDRN